MLHQGNVFRKPFFTVPPFEVICGTKAWQLPLQGIMDDDQEGSVVGFMHGKVTVMTDVGRLPFEVRRTLFLYQG